MVEFLVKRPIAVFMTFLAFVLLGITSLNLMPVSLMPEIEVPYLKVQLDEPNYTAKELEKLVIQPIRRQLLQVGNLKDIQSTTQNGNAVIDLYFEYGTDVAYAFIEVNEKIDRILSVLPKEINRPKLIKSNPSDIPLCYVHIPYPKNSSQIAFSNYIKNTVRKRLEQNESVAFVDMTGSISPEISIALNTNKLAQLNLSISDIENAIKSNNTQIGNFKIKNGHYIYDVLFEPSLQTVDDLNNLYLTTNDTRIQIKDIAEISLVRKAQKGVFLNQGEKAISLAIVSKADAKVATVKAEILSYLHQLQKDNATISFTIQQDQSDLLHIAINNLQNSLLIGALLAIFMVYLFIRNYKVAFIIALVIPFSLIISFLFLYLLGISINIVSLSGLIVGIGMMIDNSIIVIDNISQYRIKGDTIVEACAKGTYEILRPLLSSLLTTCAVFIPLIYLSGIAGILFFDQALAIIISLSISYIVSIILLPTLYVAFNIKIKEKSQKNWLTNSYTRSFNFLFKGKILLSIIGIAIVILGGFVVTKIDTEKLPEIRYNDFNFVINWNENIALAESERRTSILEKQLKNTLFSASVGEQDFLRSKRKIAKTGVKLYVQTTTPKEAEQYAQKLLLYTKQQFPNAVFSIQKSENLFEQLFSSTEADFYLKVPIKHAAQTQTIAKKIATQFPKSLVTVEKQKQVLQLEIDQRKLATYKIDNSALIQTLKSIFNANQISILKSTNEYLPIVLKKTNEDFSTIINKSFMTNKDNIRIPIANLINTKEASDFENIYADLDENYIPINITTNNHEAIINFINTNRQEEITFDGTYFEQKTFIKELLIIMLIVVLLLYFVLAAQFESLVQPLIILCEIPITVGGSIIVMYLFGISLNIMSMIGMIIMLGIVINDSILKIDTINKLRNEGNNTLLEAIHHAGNRRINAILMTSFTTILAMTPVLFTSGIGADLQKPLAFVVIIAMCIGTFVSLYIVPILYWLLTKQKTS
ncbi:multidrug resistance protein MdtC [Kordia sp. SMS9]|uniref:efflux RND transporter permease subunit n=1 Tax=Kordia sp. SMS9 TaxID=2282170 RepID=UPI000E0DEF6F|nr:efflux RND transporter permease subunit [Kordia sp. SMS9]AXG69859.1 multidrug resistance protein MdtC [Kordia sp. SMS9]